MSLMESLVRIMRSACVAASPRTMGTVTATTLSVGRTGDANGPDTLGLCVSSASVTRSGALIERMGSPSGSEVRNSNRPWLSAKLMARRSGLCATTRRACAYNVGTSSAMAAFDSAMPCSVPTAVLMRSPTACASTSVRALSRS